MLNNTKIDRIGVVLAWVLYIGLSFLMILFLQPDTAQGFDWRIFHLKWDASEYVDDYYISIHTQKANGGTEDFNTIVRGKTEYTTALTLDDKHYIKLTPILPGGTHGDVMVEMDITPHREPNRSIRF